MLEESLISQCLFFLAALIVSALLTIRKRSILIGGLCLYGLFVLRVLLFSMIIPAILVILQSEDFEVSEAFHRASGVIPVVLLYWIPAFLIAALVRLAHAAFTRTVDVSVVRASCRRLIRLARRLRLLPDDAFAHPGRPAVYRKWVGVVLGFLLAGSTHFLSGHRRAGVAWYLSGLVLGCLIVCLIAIPGERTYIAAVAVTIAALLLWLVMLKQSYRPAPRIGVLGWMAVLVIGVSLNTADRRVARFAVEAFRMTSGGMRPTLEGIHTHEISGGQTSRGVVGKFVRGERYVRWLAKSSGPFKRPVYLDGASPWCEYSVGKDRRYLPPDVNVPFRRGQRVAQGDLVWSGMVVAGDRMMVEKVSYRFRDPRRGEIVVFKTDGLPDWEPGTYISFRVAGLPGERVRIEPPWLVVDDERVTDPPIFAAIAAKEPGYAGFLSAVHAGGDANNPSDEVTLGEDEYFVLGDDTGNANDSRYWGPVSRKKIVGRVTRIYWPLNRVNALDGKW